MLHSATFSGRYLRFLFLLLTARSATSAWNSAAGYFQGGLQNTDAQLRKELFDTGFDPNVRPVKTSSEAVQVKLGLAVTNVLSLDLVTGVGQFAVWLRASWYDPQLDWNISKHNKLGQLSVGVNEIWTPDFLAYNHVEKFEKEVRHDLTKIFLYGDGGGVFWTRPAVVRVVCDIDATQFPFDKQLCTFRMSSWSMSGFLQNLTIMPYTVPSDGEGGKKSITDGSVDMSSFIGNEEFKVRTAPADWGYKYYACCPTEPWPMVIFNIFLDRKSFHYWMNIVLPTGATTVMSMTTFMLPHECGERIGLCITAMLVISAIMFVSSDLIPISEKSTLLGIYYTGCFFFSFFCLIMTVVTSLFHSQVNDGDDDGEKGTFVMFHVFGISPKKALQIAARIDTALAFFAPMSFAAFCAGLLTPAEWSVGAKAGVCFAILFGCALLMCVSFMTLYHIRRARGEDVSAMTVKNTLWRFRVPSIRMSFTKSKEDEPRSVQVVPSENQRELA